MTVSACAADDVDNKAKMTVLVDVDAADVVDFAANSVAASSCFDFMPLLPRRHRPLLAHLAAATAAFFLLFFSDTYFCRSSFAHIG